MAIVTLPGVLLSGTHAGRPAASTVAKGALYAETDTAAVFQSDGSVWSAWGAVPLLSPMTTKGDLIAGGASGAATRLPVGADAQVLTADSTQTLGMKWAAAGGGGTAARSIVQSAKVSSGGGGPGTATFGAVPASTSLFVCLAAANGAGLASLTQTNVTWTLVRHDNVGAVGALDIWVGVATGVPGTTVVGAGMSGAASMRVYEVANATYSAVGQSLFAQVGSKGSTATLHGCVAGSLIAMVVNTVGAAPAGGCVLSCGPYESETDNSAVNTFALGTALSTFAQGVQIDGASMNYSLAELKA